MRWGDLHWRVLVPLHLESDLRPRPLWAVPLAAEGVSCWVAVNPVHTPASWWAGSSGWSDSCGRCSRSVLSSDPAFSPTQVAGCLPTAASLEECLWAVAYSSAASSRTAPPASSGIPPAASSPPLAGERRLPAPQPVSSSPP